MVAERGSGGVPVITTITPPDLLTPLDRYLATLEMAAREALPLLQEGDVEYVLSPASAMEHGEARELPRVGDAMSSPAAGPPPNLTPSPPNGSLSLETVTPENSAHNGRPYPGRQNSGSGPFSPNTESWNTLDSWGVPDCM